MRKYIYFYKAKAGYITLILGSRGLALQLRLGVNDIGTVHGSCADAYNDALIILYQFIEPDSHKAVFSRYMTACKYNYVIRP